MKILSVFSGGNEITIRNTIWGQEKIFYNHREVSSKYSFFGAVHTFEVYEGTDLVEYIVKIGFNNLGVSANIWRNGEVVLAGLNATYRDVAEHKRSSGARSHGYDRPRSSYHQDLV